MTTERDYAHEADMRELRYEQLLADIDPADVGEWDDAPGWGTENYDPWEEYPWEDLEEEEDW